MIRTITSQPLFNMYLPTIRRCSGASDAHVPQPYLWAMHKNSEPLYNSDSYQHSHYWHKIGCVLKLTEYTIVRNSLTRGNMSAVMHMMQTILTTRHNGILFHLIIMMVEAYHHQHWQVHQYQQPCKANVSSVCHFECKGIIFTLNTNIFRVK